MQRILEDLKMLCFSISKNSEKVRELISLLKVWFLLTQFDVSSYKFLLQSSDRCTIFPQKGLFYNPSEIGLWLINQKSARLFYNLFFLSRLLEICTIFFCMFILMLVRLLV